jgi:hypothetical protein
MFALLITLEAPRSLDTHINLSNANAASYPGPGCAPPRPRLAPARVVRAARPRRRAPRAIGSVCDLPCPALPPRRAALTRSCGGSFFTTTPSHLQLGDVTYDGQDSECR